MSTGDTLAHDHCNEKAAKLSAKDVRLLATQTPGWKVSGKLLQRAFKFADHYQAIGFVNAVAWISNTQNHHPDMQVGYNTVAMTYSTHSAKGLTRNDFICAARVSALDLPH